MTKGKSTACDESRDHSVPAFSDALPVWLAFISLTAHGLTTLSRVVCTHIPFVCMTTRLDKAEESQVECS